MAGQCKIATPCCGHHRKVFPTGRCSCTVPYALLSAPSREPIHCGMKVRRRCATYWIVLCREFGRQASLSSEKSFFVGVVSRRQYGSVSFVVTIYVGPEVENSRLIIAVRPRPLYSPMYRRFMMRMVVMREVWDNLQVLTHFQTNFSSNWGVDEDVLRC